MATIIDQRDLGWCYDLRVQYADGTQSVLTFPQQPADLQAAADAGEAMYLEFQQKQEAARAAAAARSLPVDESGPANP
jgi:hypothetical protein